MSNNLLGDLDKDRLSLFVQEWLSVVDAGRLRMAATSNLLQGVGLFADHPHNIIRQTIEKATASDLKIFLRHHMSSKFSSPICQDEYVKNRIVEALKSPDADFEYQLLAITFLNRNALTFTLSNDWRSRSVNPLSFLAYTSTFSPINSETIIVQFQRLLTEIQEDFKKIVNPCRSETSEENRGVNLRAQKFEFAVFLLSSVAHKLKKNQVKSLTLQLLGLLEGVRKFHNLFDFPDNTLWLLSVLAIDYDAKKIIDLIKWFCSFIYSQDKKSCSWVVLTKIFSKYSSVIDNREFEAFANDNLFRVMVMHVGMASLWEVFNNNQRTILKKQMLYLLERVGRDHQFDFAAVIASLCHAFDEGERQVIKQLILKWLKVDYKNGGHLLDVAEVAIFLWQAFGFTEPEEVKRTILRLLISYCNKTSYVVHDCLRVARGAMFLWQAFDFAERNKVRRTILQLLVLSRRQNLGDYSREVKLTVLLWRACDSDQRAELKQDILRLLVDKNNVRSHGDAVMLLCLVSGDIELENAVLSSLNSCADVAGWNNQFDLSALYTLTSLHSVVGRAQFDKMKDVTMSLLKTNDDIAGLRVETMLVSLWCLLSSDQRNKAKSAIFSIDDGYYCLNEGLAREIMVRASSLWGDLDDVQRLKMRDIVLNRLWGGGYIGCQALFTSNVVEALESLRESFSYDDRKVIVSKMFNSDYAAAQPQNYLKLCKQAQQVLKNYVVMLHDEDLELVIVKLIHSLNSDSVGVQTRAADILMATICHHPHYPYELEALKDPLLKDYFLYAIETVRAAQAACIRAPVLS